MGLIIEKLTGEYYRLNDLGIFEEKRMEIGSPNIKSETTELQGMDGVHSGRTFLRERPLKAFLISLVDYLPEVMERQREIFRIFDAREPFYLSEERDKGFRWLVKCTSPFSIAEIATIGRFEVNFTSFSSFRETSLVLERRFSSPIFHFQNEGNERIVMRSPKMFETEIEFRGASTGLNIMNKTTGETWKYNGSSIESDTILLKGIASTKNGNSIFGNTNHGILSFAPGSNTVEVTGAQGAFQMLIRTRFYFS